MSEPPTSLRDLPRVLSLVVCRGISTATATGLMSIREPFCRSVPYDPLDKTAQFWLYIEIVGIRSDAELEVGFFHIESDRSIGPNYHARLNGCDPAIVYRGKLDVGFACPELAGFTIRVWIDKVLLQSRFVMIVPDGIHSGLEKAEELTWTSGPSS